MSQMFADVLRVFDKKENFVGDRLKNRMFGFTTDTNELVAKYDDEYYFIGACSLDDLAYVLRAGDTMTGALQFNNKPAHHGKIFFDDESGTFKIQTSQGARFELNAYLNPASIIARGLTIDSGVGSVKLYGQGISQAGILQRFETGEVYSRPLNRYDLPTHTHSTEDIIGGGGGGSNGVEDVTVPGPAIFVRSRNSDSAPPIWASYNLMVNGSPVPVTFTGSGAIASVDISSPNEDRILVNTPHVIRVLGGSSPNPTLGGDGQEIPLNKSWIVIDKDNTNSSVPNNPVIRVWTRNTRTLQNGSLESVNRAMYVLNKLDTNIQLYIGSSVEGMNNYATAVYNIDAKRSIHFIISELGASDVIGSQVPFRTMY